MKGAGYLWSGASTGQGTVGGGGKRQVIGPGTADIKRAAAIVISPGALFRLIPTFHSRPGPGPVPTYDTGGSL